MFLCPKCNYKIIDNRCFNCNNELEKINGVLYFTADENINLEEKSNMYIGYDNIYIHFEPSLIYWGNHFGIYGESARDIVNKYGEDIVVLDLGCGLGTATIPFAEVGVKTIGIDISKNMLEYTYKRSGSRNENLFLCKMNAYNLLIDDNSVDVIVENAMIHLVDNPEKVYQEMFRVLKADGILVRFTSSGIPIADDLKLLSKRCYDAYRDISNYYIFKLNEFGYKPNDFDNNSLEIEKKYFRKIGKEIINDYEEIFTEYMKFRIHRLEHKAHSYLQHVPNEIHNKVWTLTDQYAIDKYGTDYKNIYNYSKYNPSYEVYRKI